MGYVIQKVECGEYGQQVRRRVPSKIRMLTMVDLKGRIRSETRRNGQTAHRSTPDEGRLTPRHRDDTEPVDSANVTAVNV